MKISKILPIIAFSMLAFCNQSFATNTDMVTKPCVYIAKVTENTKQIKTNSIVNRISSYHKQIGLI